jgi:hypothetical protein
MFKQQKKTLAGIMADFKQTKDELVVFIKDTTTKINTTKAELTVMEEDNSSAQKSLRAVKTILGEDPEENSDNG